MPLWGTAMCDARIRPFRPVNDTEVLCEQDGYHLTHLAVLRDYAWPGSQTIISWMDDDRRTFHSDWPGDCPEDCILPTGHKGGHAP
jgi:hypothetical protein